ncbi:restriction endonuclease subunit S [Acinetobacter towneri]|uniref:restriction endonuclease subunit S n=1 Tax=Acinetobacter towneri TaxID=202956 RepID=UPI002935F888|nr:restriction endonuclease subunit S [Acinetobacter towneri]MDV2454859.1 restriction endonuclease subunit S [Acinetobacter towneri]
MSQLPRYESYKDSGVQWLGEIPSHWQLIAFHYVSRLKSGDSITALDFVSDGEYPVYGGNGYRGNIDRFNHDGRYVLIGRQGALCGNVNLADGKFFATEHAVVVYKNENIDTDWLYYLLDTMNLNQYSTTAAQPGISAEVIGRLKIPLPTIDEQKNIASLLNRRLAQVDALIAKQETLLEKLAEQRVALISHAVTKGLNPDVEMKESGDVFFRKVPNHWKVLALHYIVRLVSGDSITALDFVADGDYPVYGGNGFRGYIDRYTHQGNYVLIGRQGALCGNINFASGYFFATEHAVVVNPLIDLNYKWLGFLLMAMNLNQYSTTAAQPGISAEVIGRLKILLPEIEEQNQIADFIETELRDIEELENKAIVLKDKLKEYCSTLITQVVTGKIDVRNLKVN